MGPTKGLLLSVSPQSEFMAWRRRRWGVTLRVSLPPICRRRQLVHRLVGLRATGARSPAITLFPEARKFGQRLAAVTGLHERAAPEISEAKLQFKLATLAHVLAAVPLLPVTTYRSHHVVIVACKCASHDTTSRHSMPKYFYLNFEWQVS